MIDVTAHGQTIEVSIYMAGDLAQAKQVCREYCFAVGLCVTVEPLDFIYTGGEESGFRIGLLNYPRFPTDQGALLDRAYSLATLLMEKLCQQSYSIVGPTTTYWVSRRPADEPRSPPVTRPHLTTPEK